MKKIYLIVFLSLMIQSASSQKNDFAVIAYYAGNDTSQVEKFPIGKLTHIIFSFCHLQGNRLHIDDHKDSVMIRKLVSLKKKYPDLKVLLSLGGWGGCETCSDVFSDKSNRKEFARSVKDLCEDFGTDGIDLDWEYPAIQGYPGHHFKREDRDNFSDLVKQLRKTLGNKHLISFAAGGFNRFIDESIDWKKVMHNLNYVNVMTYDLVHGYSTVTGHHTPLYSTPHQMESVDNAVQSLISIGVPGKKIVIGAAMYGRVWQDVANSNNGIYQKGKFLESVAYKNFTSKFPSDSGFVYHWDEKAMAPYIYNSGKKLFVTYDDPKSMELKTKYAQNKGLGGLMFWQLTEDQYTEGLLDAIDRARVK